MCLDRLLVIWLAIGKDMGLPPFEQRIVYFSTGGKPVTLEGDNSVLLEEKAGLLNCKEIRIQRQVDPRFKMEKETAFLDAFAARRFSAAQDLLQSSGVTIDPNCVRAIDRYITGPIHHSEAPCMYRHPALTLAIQAGLEKLDGDIFDRPVKGREREEIETYMSQEGEVCEIVKLLIEKRADINAVGDESQDCESGGTLQIKGKSALCAAVQRGSPALVRILLDARADVNISMHYDGMAFCGGPCRLKPESFVEQVACGRPKPLRVGDPRLQHREDILQMLRAAA